MLAVVPSLVHRIRSMPPPDTTTSTAPVKAGPGKYVLFRLGAESYGIAVLKVREIIRMHEITPVPQVPPHILGVMNLRGRVIPILDLRLKFGLSDSTIHERTCTIVVQAGPSEGGRSLTGLVVDAIEEVATVSAADIEPPPHFGGSLRTDHILGMAKVRGAVKTLLDMDHILSTETIHLTPPRQPTAAQAPA